MFTILPVLLHVSSLVLAAIKIEQHSQDRNYCNRMDRLLLPHGAMPVSIFRFFRSVAIVESATSAWPSEYALEHV